MIFDNEDDFLAHYGVKGMKWGVVKKEDKAPKRTPEQEAARVDRNRKIKIGLAVAGTALVAYGAYKMVDSGQHRQIAAKGAQLVNKTIGTWKKDASRSGPMSAEAIREKIVKNINPDFGKLGANNNCRRATFAYEMNRRGFDVKATKTLGASGQGLGGYANAISPGQKNYSPIRKVEFLQKAAGAIKAGVRDTNDPQKAANEFLASLSRGQKLLFDTYAETGKAPGDFSGAQKSASIMKWLKTQPDGARGELQMTWRAGGGHSMAWEMIEGRPHIFDAQANKHFTDTPEAFAEFSKYTSMMRNASSARLDNVDLDTDFLKRWVK